MVDEGWQWCDIDRRQLKMALRAHLVRHEGRVSTGKEQKADCGIWSQRWDLGGLICSSDMIRLECGGRKSWLG